MDIIIVGGGMVGATLAALLGAGGREVVVLDEGDPPTAPDAAEAPPDLRVSSVNRASASVFEQAGAWDAMLAHRACPFRRLSVWDITGHGTTFHAEEADYDGFGWFIENRVIRAALYQSLTGSNTVEWRSGVRPTAIATGAATASVTLSNGAQLAANLVVGADGPRSAVRHHAGISAHSEDYQQRALVTNVRTRLPQQDITWQRFTPRGPQAFLPLAGSNASLVWYETPPVVRDLEGLGDADLASAIQDAFPATLGAIDAVHGRASFAVSRQHATRYTAPRIALVGDAAHTIHPLLGQGLNLGIEGARTLAAAITTNPEHDPGTAPVLATYERHHRPRALALMAATNTCHHLFTRPPGSLRRLASSLLGLARYAPIGRREAMRFAMGLPIRRR